MAMSQRNVHLIKKKTWSFDDQKKKNKNSYHDFFKL